MGMGMGLELRTWGIGESGIKPQKQETHSRQADDSLTLFSLRQDSEDRPGQIQGPVGDGKEWFSSIYRDEGRGVKKRSRARSFVCWELPDGKGAVLSVVGCGRGVRSWLVIEGDWPAPANASNAGLRTATCDRGVYAGWGVWRGGGWGGPWRLEGWRGWWAALGGGLGWGFGDCAHQRPTPFSAGCCWPFHLQPLRHAASSQRGRPATMAARRACICWGG